MKKLSKQSASNSILICFASIKNQAKVLPPQTYYFDERIFNIRHLKKFAQVYNYFIETFDIKFKETFFLSAVGVKANKNSLRSELIVKRVIIKRPVADAPYINCPIDFDEANMILDSLISREFINGFSQSDMIKINNIWKNIKTNIYNSKHDYFRVYGAKSYTPTKQ